MLHIFALPFLSSLQVIIDTLGMPIDYSKSQPMDDKLSLKWAWSGHVNHLNFGGQQSYIWNG